MEFYTITSETLLIDDVSHILNSNFKLKLADPVRENIEKCRNFLDEKLKS